MIVCIPIAEGDDLKETLLSIMKKGETFIMSKGRIGSFYKNIGAYQNANKQDANQSFLGSIQFHASLRLSLFLTVTVWCVCQGKRLVIRR